jgi:serine/threonine protein kinase
MDPERWRQVETLYHAVREQTPADREARLAGADPEVRREVEALLAQGDPTNLLATAAIRDALLGAAVPSVAVGPQLGPYRIVSALGRGGMGEVFRARDPKLERDVALKTLPAEYASEPGWLARFHREARTLAALNHPNIAAIYGLEEADGVHFLVMELVEGETLADRLDRERTSGHRGLPLDDTLSIAHQVAEALEAAHAKGITHRDIKPANVKLTPEGRVKVLDFGLAKTQRAEPQGDPSQWTTMSLGTKPGIMLGTPAYMSPEQARGQAVDHRTDIWAFGCVLYELLAGTRAFPGDTVPDVMSAVLTRTPDWGALSPSTPEHLRGLLRHCLEKDPDRRLASMTDVRAVIEQVQAGHRGIRRRTVVAAIAAARVIAIALLVALNVDGARDHLVGLFASPVIRSIAVLPLRNASGNPAQDYFADGMTESLIREIMPAP